MIVNFLKFLAIVIRITQHGENHPIKPDSWTSKKAAPLNGPKIEAQPSPPH
jgi:hypothetical protein